MMYDDGWVLSCEICDETGNIGEMGWLRIDLDGRDNGYPNVCRKCRSDPSNEPTIDSLQAGAVRVWEQDDMWRKDVRTHG